MSRIWQSVNGLQGVIVTCKIRTEISIGFQIPKKKTLCYLAREGNDEWRGVFLTILFDTDWGPTGKDNGTY